MVPLQPPGLAVHLTPFLRGVDGNLGAPEVDPAAGAPRRFLGLFLVVLFAGFHDAQAVARAVDQLLAVAAQNEAAQAADQRLGLARFEIKNLQHGLCRRLAGVAPVVCEGSFHWHVRKQDLTFRERRDLVIARLGNRQGLDALGDAVEIDL